MTILWIPHTTFQPGTKARATYFIERLVTEHTIHVLCWDVPIRRTLPGLVSSLRLWTRVRDGVIYHHLPRLPVFFHGRRPLFTQAIFRWMVRRIVRECGIDVVICACNWYALGFPPSNLPVPLVIDYFDLLQDVHEDWYFTHCDAIICASTVMLERARRFPVPCFYVPNGLDTRLFQGVNGQAVREEYGLDGSRVVSLIGLTASPRLYFLDAIELVARQFPDVKCLVVGDGGLLPAIKAGIKGREELFRIVGPVPYDRIPAFFACTDVGLYPGDKAPHFDAALPIKVLEYSAAGKPVVTPPLEELVRLGFPNIVFAEPNPAAFAEGICRALRDPVVVPDLSRFEIDYLTKNLVEILEQVVARRPRMSGWPMEEASVAAIPWSQRSKVTEQLLRDGLNAVKDLFQGDLLDLGCGMKPYQPIFGVRVRRWIGLDFESTPSGRSKAEIFGSALAVPFKGERFGVVLCTQVLEHVPAPEKLLQEANRVLRRGGYLVLTAPQTDQLHEEPHDYFRFTCYGLKTLAEKASFEVVAVRPLGGAIATVGQMVISHLNWFRRIPLLGPAISKVVNASLAWVALKLDRLSPVYGGGAMKDTLNWLLLARKT